VEHVPAGGGTLSCAWVVSLVCVKPFAVLATMNPVVVLVRSFTSVLKPAAVSLTVIRILSPADINRRVPPGVPSVVMFAAVIGSPQLVVSSSMVRAAHHLLLSGQPDPGG